MWWHEQRKMAGQLARVVVILAAAGLAAGCFQPLYGQMSPTGQPALAESLRGVEVLPITAASGSAEARVGTEVRNQLIFDITGGSGVAANPTHRLLIQIASTRNQVIVDIQTARPDLENYGINAVYTLIEMVSGKAVITGQTFSRVSFDIPGQQQRFARARGLRDAENRAAKVIAENIKSRLASYFIAGT